MFKERRMTPFIELQAFRNKATLNVQNMLWCNNEERETAPDQKA